MLEQRQFEACRRVRNVRTGHDIEFVDGIDLLEVDDNSTALSIS